LFHNKLYLNFEQTNVAADHMPRSERYDHVLSEEFDDYEDRRQCPSFRATLRHGSRARCPPVRSTLTKADMCLIVLMVSLAAGILWFIYDPGYDININGGRLNSAGAPREKNLKKMQKPPLLKRVWHLVRPSTSMSCRKICQKNVDAHD